MIEQPTFGLSTQRLELYWRLTRMDKPIGIFLLLWPAAWALLIAGNGKPDILVTFVIATGVVLMRAAGCVINDYADRDFDPHVKRTKSRPIAAGLVSPREALWLFVILCLVSFGLVLLTNPLTIALSVPGAFLAASYPFMKRYTYLPQAYLGLAFGWAVPMTFAAQTGGIPWIGWELYFTTILWALVYDTMYAMVDRDDDLKIGVKSTAILFGDMDRVLIGMLQIFVLLLLYGVGRQTGLGLPYFLGLLVAAGLFAYQQFLIRKRDRDGCFKAFLNNHWFGATVFAGLAADYLLRA
ncbi:4-hydroxybenzoate octaprenyltransferase [Methylocaldum szegediense]|uniref:4-hydroxybenzoate octaprenyltransferase n=1 Tax=Methylocaldum szegediense TaxID=73780 RepID=A0ABM9HZ27_9GAMM|nr:4-hydroxybenzoate octaprenyltransferase [Methylocaldum szegediense]CAI8778861.1 4-hydroxybenzoate octaprenyltransferase [Methylocaldum szegediense]